MGSIIMWLPSIISAIIEIIKLLRELKKHGENVSSCTAALKDARTTGNVTRIQEIIERLRKGRTDC